MSWRDFLFSKLSSLIESMNSFWICLGVYAVGCFFIIVLFLVGRSPFPGAGAREPPHKVKYRQPDVFIAYLKSLPLPNHAKL